MKNSILNPKQELNPSSLSYLPVKIYHNQKQTIITTRNHIASAVLFLFAGSCAVIPIMKGLPAGPSLYFYAIGALLCWMGTHSLRTKRKLSLNFDSLTYTWTAGFFPKVTVSQGNFEDFLAVYLSQTFQFSDSENPDPNWRLTLFNKDKIPLVDLHLGPNHATAMQIGLEWSQRLGVEFKPNSPL